MKQLLTPDAIEQLIAMSRVDLNRAQRYLDRDIGGTAQDGAVQQIELDLLDGKLSI
jgi:hypothetical protein